MLSNLISHIKRCVPTSIKENIKIFYYKSKIKRSESEHNTKTTIVFLVERVTVWNSIQTVYLSAKKNPDITVYLVALPERESNPNNTDTSKTYDFCKNISEDDVVNSYDASTGKFIDLKELHPDYIFLNVPYEIEYPEGFKFFEMAGYAKLCFVPYGYGMLNSVTTATGLNLYMLAHISYLFSDGSVTYNYCRKELRLVEKMTGQKIFSFGFPRFDLLPKENISNANTQIKKICYLPRWTMAENVQNGHEPSSFLLFKDAILDFAQAHKELEFIIRPHPILFGRYVKSGQLSQEDVDKYIARIKSMPNVQLDESPDYVETFLWSDAAIFDYSSTIAEYSVLNKPILYFGTDKRVAEDHKKLFETFYPVSSWNDVETEIEKLKSGIDEKFNQRKKVASDVFMLDEKSAGDRIVEFLFDKNQHNRRE